jgi:hypothetical protein
MRFIREQHPRKKKGSRTGQGKPLGHDADPAPVKSRSGSRFCRENLKQWYRPDEVLVSGWGSSIAKAAHQRNPRLSRNASP